MAPPRKVPVALTDEQRKLVENNRNFHFWWISNVLPKYPFLNTHYEKEEAEGVAALAVVRAAVSFDASLGWTFAALASQYIYRALLTDVPKHQVIRLPEKASELKRQPIGKYIFDYPDSHDGFSDSDRRDEVETLQDRVYACIQQLPERQQYVLKERFWSGKVLAEVGREIGVSKERVRQIQVEAMDVFEQLYRGMVAV